LITLVGGKLTVYRASAEQVINKVKKLIPPPKKHKHCSTRNIKLES